MGEIKGNPHKAYNEAYIERENRVNKAIALEKPDRVPIVSVTDGFMVGQAGLSEEDAMVDYGKLNHAWLDSSIKLDFDMAPSPVPRMSGRIMELMGIKTIKWAGQDLPANSQYQYVETEMLKADEYDAFLSNPGDFTIRTLLPRTADTLGPLGFMPALHTFAFGYATITSLPAILSTPPVLQTLKTLVAVGEEMGRFNTAIADLSGKLSQNGYPVAFGAIANSAFDIVSDFLRGMRGSMMDMFRQPDKLKAAVELFTPITIESAIFMAKSSGSSRVFIPLHRGADTFMSNEQFAEFYWPSLKALLLALIDAGLTPLPFFEGSYTNRLEFLAELPKGKVLAHMDQVDINRFKKVLGDTVCFWGNVPASYLITGTADQTRDYVKMLIDTFGDTGGLVIDGAVEGIPPQAKLENVVAMIETARDYGKYT